MRRRLHTRCIHTEACVCVHQRGRVSPPYPPHESGIARGRPVSDDTHIVTCRAATTLPLLSTSSLLVDRPVGRPLCPQSTSTLLVDSRGWSA